MDEKGVEILRGLLEADFRLVLTQVSVLKKKVDLLCFGKNEIIAVEVKSRVGEIPHAIGQCLFYKEGVNRIFIALPEEEARKVSAEKRILKDVGFGFIVSREVEVKAS